MALGVTVANLSPIVGAVGSICMVFGFETDSISSDLNSDTLTALFEFGSVTKEAVFCKFPLVFRSDGIGLESSSAFFRLLLMASSTKRLTISLFRKRISRFAGWTFTSICLGLIVKKRNAGGYLPF